MNDAAEQTNIPDLQHLVNCGNKIDQKSSVFGESPIHMVVESRGDSDLKLQTLQVILENNASVDNMDSNGWTALHHAASLGDAGSVQMLLQNGANVEAFSN